MSGEVREQTDLATWLLACLAEDEEVIRRNLGEKGLGDSGSFPDYQTYSDSDTEAANDYLDRFPPPRLLAECDTKRRIIELAAKTQVWTNGAAGATAGHGGLRGGRGGRHAEAARVALRGQGRLPRGVASVIPEAEKDLTPEEAARWAFTKLAAGLVKGGVSPDLVMRDAREGCDMAQTGLFGS